MKHSLRKLTYLFLVLVRAVAATACCDPGLLTQPGRAAPAVPESDATMSLSVEPAAPLETVPPILRIRVLLEGVSNAELREGPGHIVLIAGQVGPAHLGQLARDEISNALAERIVPTIARREGDGSVVLAPTERLVAGEVYSVATGTPKLAREITVAADDAVPHLGLTWPPDGATSQGVDHRVAVWCGAEALPPVNHSAVLFPTDVPATWRLGTTAQGRGHRCVHLESSGLPADTAVVAPPLLNDGSGEPLGRLDPVPLGSGGSPDPASPAVCEPNERPFGPGCVAVADDRLYLRTPLQPLLWTVTLTQPAPLDMVLVSRPGEHGLIQPLPPSSEVALVVDVLDRAGRLDTTIETVTTAAPMAHVVINEVLANPVGEEPDQEWVELYNDGLATASLGGYVLTDIGGETLLPDAALAPGAFALVVNEDFDETSDYDPAPAPGTLVLRVAKLGKGGLNNQGEPLQLRDPDGNPVSRFPASPKPKAGISVIRVAPGAPDGNPSSFMRCPELPTPGAPNLDEGAEP